MRRRVCGQPAPTRERRTHRCRGFSLGQGIILAKSPAHTFRLNYTKARTPASRAGKRNCALTRIQMPYEGSRTFVLAKRLSIDFEQFFSRAPATKNSDVRFRSVKVFGKKLDEPGVGLAVLSRRTNRDPILIRCQFGHGFLFGLRLDRQPNFSRHGSP